MTSTGPILVTGADRSGTTLLYTLLASHPDVSMVRRTNMWRWFDRRFGDLREPANLDQCLATMRQYARLAVLEPDFEQIRAEFLLGEPTYGRLFDVFHSQHARRLGRPRWADKSLHTEHCADRILDELPSARIIHMVRDPRDRYASIARRYEGRSKGIGATTGRWLSSVRRGRRNLRRHPQRYMVLRYETLATAPEASLREVCAFLDLPFTAQMLAMRGVSGESGRSGNSSFGSFAPGVISTRSIGRYASVLSTRDVALIQTLAGRQMAEHGYLLDRNLLPGRSKLRFYSVDLPSGGSRLAGWIALNRLRDEGIPAHRLSGTGTP